MASEPAGTGGKIVFPQGAVELWVALGVQRLAGFAAKGLAPVHGLDPVPLVLLGDRRQTHDVQSCCAIT